MRVEQREAGREGGREGEKEGGREGGMEGGKEGGRLGGKEGGSIPTHSDMEELLLDADNEGTAHLGLVLHAVGSVHVCECTYYHSIALYPCRLGPLETHTCAGDLGIRKIGCSHKGIPLDYQAVRDHSREGEG